MRRYRDRVEAGRVLAAELSDSLDSNALVLGIPRGGVVVAAQVSASHNAELDVANARKLGAPLNPELAMGAVDADGKASLDELLVKRLGATAEYVAAETERELEELKQRMTLYRADRPEPAMRNRVVVVVDDGIATGATMSAVLSWARRRQPKKLVCATPVGASETLDRLANSADLVVCPMRPASFMSVGEWYEDFAQTSNDEVVALLAERSSSVGDGSQDDP